MSYLPSYDDSTLFLGEQQPVIPRDPVIPDDPTIVGPGRYDIPTTVGSNLPLSTMPNQPKATMAKKYPNSEEIIRIRKSDEPSPNSYFQKSAMSSMGPQKLSTKPTSPSYRQSKTTNADRIKTYNPGLTEKDNELTEGPEATRYSPEEPLFDARYTGESKIHSKSPRYSLRDPYKYEQPPPYPGPQDYEVMDQSSYPRSPTFRMTGRPVTPKKLMDNPGPGAYSPRLEKESRSPKPPKFVITYKPFIDYDNKVPGPCHYQYEHTIRSGAPFSQKYSMHIRPPPPKMSDVPGPGTYDPDTFQWVSTKKPSPKIGNGNRTDFVTHAWTPGPGSYFPTEPYSPKSPSSSRRRPRSTKSSPRKPNSARSADQPQMDESNNNIQHSPISARKFVPSTEKKGFSMGTSPRFPKVTGTWHMK